MEVETVRKDETVERRVFWDTLPEKLRKDLVDACRQYIGDADQEAAESLAIYAASLFGPIGIELKAETLALPLAPFSVELQVAVGNGRSTQRLIRVKVKGPDMEEIERSAERQLDRLKGSSR